MTVRIRVDPDDLRETGRLISRAANSLRSRHEQLSAAWNLLSLESWEGEHRQAVELLRQQARYRLKILLEQMEDLVRFLNERAARFEEADRAGLPELARLVASFASAQREWTHLFRQYQPATLPQARIKRLLLLVGKTDLPPVSSPLPHPDNPLTIQPLRPIPIRWQPLFSRITEHQ